MKLIFEQQKQKERDIFDAMKYDECVIEYLDNEVDVETLLIVRDDDLENIIVFWRNSVYTYSMSGKWALDMIYSEIKDAYSIDRIVDIYPVSSTITFERIKE